MLWDQFRKILSTRLQNKIEDKRFTPAAVLLLLYEKKGETYLLLTKRTEKVADHKGQISFPGGVRDKEDKSLEITALREASEEVGIDIENVEILGILDDCLTVETNYVITPVVGILPTLPRFRINSEEVDRIIEIPLAFFQDFFKHKPTSNFPDGEAVAGYPEFQYGQHLIWGATARILEQFLSLLALLKENGDVPGVIFEKGRN